MTERPDNVLFLCAGNSARSILAAESCPYWPDQPMTAHWGVLDPVTVEGSDTERWLAFRSAFSLLDRIKLQERLDAIGKTPIAPERDSK